MGDADRGLGAWLAGDVSEEDRAVDRRRAAAGTVGGHMPTSLGEARRDAGDAVTGFLHGFGIDAAGARLSQIVADPASIAEWGTGPVFDRLLAQADEEERVARDRSPFAHAGGSGSGEAALYAIGTGEASAAAEAIPLAAEAVPLLTRALATGGRIARGAVRPALETAAYSTATSRGHTPEAVRGDAGTGLALGGGVSVLGGMLGEGLSAMSSPAARRSAHRAADLARIGSPRGESMGTISNRPRDELIETLGRGGRGRDERTTIAAQAIRDSGIVGPFSSAGEIADRAGAAQRRAREAADSIRGEADAAGASVPAAAVPDALERYAESLDPMALGRWADAPREEARVWREAITPGQRGAEMRSHPAFGSADEAARERSRAHLTELLSEPMPPPSIAEVPGPDILRESRPLSEIIPGWADMSAAERSASRARYVDEANAAAYAPRPEAVPVDPARVSAGPADSTAASPAAARARPRRVVDDVRRMQTDAQEAGLDDLWSTQPSDATPTPHDPGGPTADDAASARAEVLAGHAPMAIADDDLIARILQTDRITGASRHLRATEAAPPSGLSESGLTIPRERAEDALRILDRTTQWVTPTGQTLAPDTEVARGMRREVRGTIDDSMAPYLSPERMAEFPAARRRESHAIAIGDVARESAERAMGRSSVASAMQAAGPVVASGGSALPAAAAGLGYRMIRGRGASTSATALEALARVLDATPGAMARWRPLLERARRGGTLDIAHRLLSEDDPEYSTEAERAIGGSADVVTTPSGRRFRRRAPP